MKKLIVSLFCLGLMASIAFGGYAVVGLDRGNNTVRNVGVSKITQIEVSGSAVADGTVTIYKQNSTLTASNLLYSVTCSSGAVTYTTTNTVFVLPGDVLFRAGTATNGLCRLIVTE